MICILLLMILAHIIDDFVLQPICLSKLKQREWWEKEIGGKEKLDNSIYRNDYKMGLFTHSLSWSIMIHLPIIFLVGISSQIVIAFSVLSQCAVHYVLDYAKANAKCINLVQDQFLHYMQIIITFYAFTLL